MDKELILKLKDCKTELIYIVTNENVDILTNLHKLIANRKIKLQHVKEIVESIKKGTYIPPIIVSSDIQTVIDGHHRIEAALLCAQLNIPFSMKLIFEKNVDAVDACITMNNTQKSWNPSDRLHSYCTQKLGSYLTFRKFMDDNPKYFVLKSKYNITSALVLINSCVSVDKSKKPMAPSKYERAFKHGKLVCTEEMVQNCQETFEELKTISSILNDNMAPFKRYRIKAWVDAKNVMNISSTDFMAKLVKYVKKNKWEDPAEYGWFERYLQIAAGIK